MKPLFTLLLSLFFLTALGACDEVPFAGKSDKKPSHGNYEPYCDEDGKGDCYEPDPCEEECYEPDPCKDDCYEPDPCEDDCYEPDPCEDDCYEPCGYGKGDDCFDPCYDKAAQNDCDQPFQNFPGQNEWKKPDHWKWPAGWKWRGFGGFEGKGSLRGDWDAPGADLRVRYKEGNCRAGDRIVRYTPFSLDWRDASPDEGGFNVDCATGRITVFLVGGRLIHGQVLGPDRMVWFFPRAPLTWQR